MRERESFISEKLSVRGRDSGRKTKERRNERESEATCRQGRERVMRTEAQASARVSEAGVYM